jgi:hypothetical protein
MTPKHLCIFCLTQLGCLAAGLMMARKCRSIFFQLGPGHWPKRFDLLADYGWWLVIVPILCVLLLPRRREEESRPEFSNAAMVITAAGVITIVGTLFPGLDAVLYVFRGSGRE